MSGEGDGVGLSPQDVEHLRLLAIFHYVVGGLVCLGGCFPIFHVAIGASMVFDPGGFGGKGERPPAAFGLMFLGMGLAIMLTFWASGVATILAGRFLTQRRRWTYCLVAAAVAACTCMPLGTALGVFTIIVLLRPAVKAAFEATH